MHCYLLKGLACVFSKHVLSQVQLFSKRSILFVRQNIFEKASSFNATPPLVLRQTLYCNETRSFLLDSGSHLNTHAPETFRLCSLTGSIQPKYDCISRKMYFAKGPCEAPHVSVFYMLLCFPYYLLL